MRCSARFQPALKRQLPSATNSAACSRPSNKPLQPAANRITVVPYALHYARGSPRVSGGSLGGAMNRLDVFVNGRLLASRPIENGVGSVHVDWLKSGDREDSFLAVGGTPFHALADGDKVLVRTVTGIQDQRPTSEIEPDGSIGTRRTQALRRIGFDTFINERLVQSCRVGAGVAPQSITVFITWAAPRPKIENGLLDIAIHCGSDRHYPAAKTGDEISVLLVTDRA